MKKLSAVVSVVLSCLAACKKTPAPDPDDVVFALPAPKPEPLRPFVAIAAGSRHGLALDDRGVVHAWGKNSEGQTGVPETLRGVIQIAAGSDFSAALRSDGTVAVWGKPLPFHEPLPPLPGNVAQIAAGYSHLALVLADGSVRIFGGMGWKNWPTNHLRDIIQVAVGQGFVLALTRKGKVLLWHDAGPNDFPKVPANLRGAQIIGAGVNHGLAYLRDGRTVVWGPNYAGENDVPELGPVKHLAGGLSASFALLADGTIRHWGNTKNGEDQIPLGLRRAKAIAIGLYVCSFGLSEEGKLFAWKMHDTECVTAVPREVGQP